MGILLRQFWQPVAYTAELEPGTAMTTRVLGEDLTFYRGQSGEPHLVAHRCAHRGTFLAAGWVEGECIRCFYHGWTYDGTGQCVEMPAEDASFARKVTIAAYPVYDYHGLLFAYLGPGDLPPFPRRIEIEQAGIVWAQSTRQVWPSNWLQQVENSLDATHVSFVHCGGQFGEAITRDIPQLEYEETEFGIIQRATRAGGNVRESDFQFPNANHIILPVPGDDSLPWYDLFVWKVPIDETHTGMFSISSSPIGGEAGEQIKEKISFRQGYNAYDYHEDIMHKRMPANMGNLVQAQDYLAQVGQGAIADRSAERLGQSDAGVILLRRIMRRELDLIKKGRPTKQWRMRSAVADLPVPPTATKATATLAVAGV